MKDFVSKTRVRQTQKREKRNFQSATVKSAWSEQMWMRLLPALFLWAATLSALHIQSVFSFSSAAGREILAAPGDAAFLAAGLLTVAFFIHIIQPDLLRRPRSVLLLTALALLAVLSARLFVYAGESVGLAPHIAVYGMPFVLAPMLAAMLAGGPAAMAVGAWTGLVMGMAAPEPLRYIVFTVALSVAVVAASTGCRIRKRAQALKTGFLATAFGALVLAAFATRDIANASAMVPLLPQQLGACLISGFIASIVALLLLPIFESAFHITTDITLLELSDLGHPLLQRLALEAPGTYHHSLVAALLAQAACDTIGANALLARTATYFHDIGKLTKPNFFTENTMNRSNPHDDLPPSMSALVIIAHVKEGLSLALLHKLPESVRRILREHHGTSLISYFHYKAKAQLELALEGKEGGAGNGGGAKINESDFRYPGPKPSTPESAIVCLADAVEAASRSMEKITPAHIEDLVDSIVSTRIDDGQLDEASLTLAQIARIKKSFVFSLTNMLHGRTPYPKDENRDKQPAKPETAKPQTPREPGAAPGAPA
jgi:cyclic-di-AMP phosphodiesterase PgpH